MSTLSQQKEADGLIMPTQSKLQEDGRSSRRSPQINSSPSKRKRLTTTDVHFRPAAKRVKSPATRAPKRHQSLTLEKKLKASAMKQNQSPKAMKRNPSPKSKMQVRSPLITSSPMMRLLVSPVVMGASPILPSCHVQRSPTPRLSSSPEASAQPSIHGNIPSALPNGSKPRKLRSAIWKEVEPIYHHEKLVQGRCTYCNEIFPAAKKSRTSHIKRHLNVCEEKAKVQNMVEKLQSSTSSKDGASLTDWKFDPQRTRGELVRMIVLHELPFAFVEYDGFIRYSASLNPIFKVVCRTTIKLDSIEIFQNYRSVLRDMLKNYKCRVSLTADAWTSKGNVGYFCITCHYIDDDWKVQKKIIRFCYIRTPHDAFNMYNVMLKSIRYYNIENKLFSVTLDNASVNTSMIGQLHEHLFMRQYLPSDGELFHVRCAAHVFNLIVKDGLQSIEGVIQNVRESVKYVKSSQSKKEKFEEIIADLGMSVKKRPQLDMPTRWNSTYLMLKSAILLQVAFHEFSAQDLNYNYCPSPEEWERAEVVCRLLKVFKKGTKVVSGSKYPTSNLYFHHVWEVKKVLKEGALSSNLVVIAMVKEMQKKFDKYWKLSYLKNCIPVVIDPRFKFGFIEFRLREAFGDSASTHITRVENAVTNLFNSYASGTDDTSEYGNEQSGVSVAEGCPWDDWSHHLSFQRNQSTTELDRYLQDELFSCDEKDFDILHWWKMHAAKYLIMARMARDVLAVPASTVASESAFSTGSRVISDYRSSLSTSTVEALICFQDWFRVAGFSYDHILSSVNLDLNDEGIDL